MNAEKKKNLVTWGLFGAAVLLLAASVTGSSRAALTYYNENYQADLEMSAPIGVTLTAGEDHAADGTAAPVSTEMENLVPGKSYPVRLGVENTGEIDAYVRVILRCYWKDENGKRRDVSPEWIEKGIPEGWLEADSTKEQTVLYYRNPVAPGTKLIMVEDLSVSPEVAKYATWNTDGTTTTYDYKGLTLVVEAEADAVQTHHAAAAMESAWGRAVTLDGDTITSVQ